MEAMGEMMKANTNLHEDFHKFLSLNMANAVLGDGRIKTATVFNAILAKERARVDRNSHVISLVTFKVGPLDYGTDTTKYFLDQLKKQIRITDEIGWLDSYTIGVLLFNALSEEASRFIEKIEPILPQTKSFTYSISTYPEGKTDHSGNGGIGNICHQAIPGPIALNGNKRATDQHLGLSLQSIFFNRTSALKRLADIVLSSLALIALSPLMLLIGIAVKCTSKGPVFFRQQRAGLGGVPFTFLKFRTMQVDADTKKSELQRFNERTGPVFKMKDDPRVTRLGSFLRQWSLDELPQFINVLKGDMSMKAGTITGLK